MLSACGEAERINASRFLPLDSPILSVLPEGTPSPQSASIDESAGTPSEEANVQFLLIEEIVILLLLVAVLVGIAAKRLRVPYTVGLVLMGLALSLGVKLEVNIAPNLILALLLPPLIFEAAFHLNLSELRYNLAYILALAIPGVVLTAILVGGIVSWGTGLALPAALVFGALVSATDPVSVIALFRSMGVPRRLQVLLESESLFNDGTAIVVFDLVVIASLKGLETFNWGTGLADFVRVSGGGIVIGLVLGSIISQVIGQIDDHLVETTLTSILAYGSYLIADVVGVSGVLAVVAAGLVNGNIGPRGMSPTTRIVVFNFWEYVAFLANSFIFLLIGLQIEPAVLFENWRFILWAIMGVLVARAITVYGFSWIGRDFPGKWRQVLYWGGLRGAICLALALSLPEALGSTTIQIKVMAFGVVLFTLLVQGFSMAPLVRRLGIVERTESQEEYERRHARAVASRLAYEHLKRRNRQGLLSDYAWDILSPSLEQHNESLTQGVRKVLASAPDLEAEELDIAHREYLRAQRSALTNLLKDGVINDDVYSQLISEIDAALLGPQTGWPELFGQMGIPSESITRLMTAVVREKDVESAISALTKLGITVTCLPGTGGFLENRNTVLLIGLAEGQEEAIVSALNKSCRKRVEYTPFPLGMSDPILPIPTPLTVGGATIFTFEVEKFEVL